MGEAVFNPVAHLENSIFKIKIVVTEMESIGVDTQEDLNRARKFYEWKRKEEEENENSEKD